MNFTLDNLHVSKKLLSYKSWQILDFQEEKYYQS